MVFKDGKVSQQMIGVKPKTQIRQAIDAAL
jgi:hypothetical protein